MQSLMFYDLIHLDIISKLKAMYALLTFQDAEVIIKYGYIFIFTSIKKYLFDKE